jgi:hypothetical protein
VCLVQRVEAVQIYAGPDDVHTARQNPEVGDDNAPEDVRQDDDLIGAAVYRCLDTLT